MKTEHEDDDRFEQGQLQVRDELFAERVQQGFGPYHDDADLYLRYVSTIGSVTIRRQASR